MAEKTSNRGHEKQIGLKCFPQDMANINFIMKEQGFKFESDAIRYALTLYKHNSELHEILVTHKEEMVRLGSEIKNISWRNNELYLLVLKIARFMKLVPPETK